MKLMSSLLLAFSLLYSYEASATQLIYQPINPNFGGAPANGTNMLAEANAIDTFTDPNAPAPYVAKSSLQQFQENLQQFILNRVASSVTGQIIDPAGNLVPGTITTQDFIIDVVSLGGGGMKIVTTDKNSGQTTSFQIN